MLTNGRCSQLITTVWRQTISGCGYGYAICAMGGDEPKAAVVYRHKVAAAHSAPPALVAQLHQALKTPGVLCAALDVRSTVPCPSGTQHTGMLLGDRAKATAWKMSIRNGCDSETVALCDTEGQQVTYYTFCLVYLLTESAFGTRSLVTSRQRQSYSCRL